MPFQNLTPLFENRLGLGGDTHTRILGFTEWYSTLGMDSIVAIIQRTALLKEGTGDVQVRIAIQTATVRTTAPDAWNTSDDDWYTDAGIDCTGSIDISALTAGKLFVRFGLAYKATSSSLVMGQVCASLQVAWTAYPSLPGAPLESWDMDGDQVVLALLDTNGRPSILTYARNGELLDHQHTPFEGWSSATLRLGEGLLLFDGWAGRIAWKTVMGDWEDRLVEEQITWAVMGGDGQPWYTNGHYAIQNRAGTCNESGPYLSGLSMLPSPRGVYLVDRQYEEPLERTALLEVGPSCEASVVWVGSWTSSALDGCYALDAEGAVVSSVDYNACDSERSD